MSEIEERRWPQEYFAAFAGERGRSRQERGNKLRPLAGAGVGPNSAQQCNDVIQCRSGIGQRRHDCDAIRTNEV